MPEVNCKPGPAVAAKDTDWVVSLCGKMEELLGEGDEEGTAKEGALQAGREGNGERDGEHGARKATDFCEELE